jgi:hypothetical protein
MSTGEPDATETGHVRFGGGPSKKDQITWHLVGGLPYLTHGICGSPGGATPPGHPTRLAALIRQAVGEPPYRQRA